MARFRGESDFSSPVKRFPLLADTLKGPETIHANTNRVFELSAVQSVSAVLKFTVRAYYAA